MRRREPFAPLSAVMPAKAGIQYPPGRMVPKQPRSLGKAREATSEFRPHDPGLLVPGLRPRRNRDDILWLGRASAGRRPPHQPLPSSFRASEARPGTGEARRLRCPPGGCRQALGSPVPARRLRAVRDDARRILRSSAGAAHPPLSAVPTSPPQGGRKARGAPARVPSRRSSPPQAKPTRREPEAPLARQEAKASPPLRPPARRRGR